MKALLILKTLLAVLAVQTLVSCASEEPKRRERVPPSVSDSGLPWNRPRSWEGSARYGSALQQSR